MRKNIVEKYALRMSNYLIQIDVQKLDTKTVELIELIKTFTNEVANHESTKKSISPQIQKNLPKNSRKNPQKKS